MQLKLVINMTWTAVFQLPVLVIATGTTLHFGFVVTGQPAQRLVTVVSVTLQFTLWLDTVVDTRWVRHAAVEFADRFMALYCTMREHTSPQRELVHHFRTLKCTLGRKTLSTALRAWKSALRFTNIFSTYFLTCRRAGCTFALYLACWRGIVLLNIQFRI